MHNIVTDVITVINKHDRDSVDKQLKNRYARQKRAGE